MTATETEIEVEHVQIGPSILLWACPECEGTLDRDGVCPDCQYFDEGTTQDWMVKNASKIIAGL